MKKLSVNVEKLLDRFKEIILNAETMEDLVIYLNAADMLSEIGITSSDQEAFLFGMITSGLDNYLMEDEKNA